MNILTVSGLSSSSQPIVDWSFIRMQRMSEIESSNPKYPRLVQLGAQGLVITHSNATVGITLLDLIALAVQYNNQLTWPPQFTQQPSSQSVPADPPPVELIVAVLSELAVTYKWQISTDTGNTWTDISSGGNYHGTDTNNLEWFAGVTAGIYWYRCVATSARGATNSNIAIITVAA